MQLSESFKITVVRLHGAEGEAWLQRLPDILTQAVKRWQLSQPQPLTGRTGKYVALAFSRLLQRSVVIKIGFPDSGFQQERQALTFYDGQGCVKLLDDDRTNAALLLEALQPGHSLKSLFPAQDHTATAYAIEVMQTLHQGKSLTTGHTFPTLSKWLTLLSDFQSKLITEMERQRAFVLAEKLISSTRDTYLLHGDLHHENILQHQHGWMAIDPHGVAGDLSAEVAAFIRNPIPLLLKQADPEALIATRIKQFSQGLNLPKQRLIDWSYVLTVLATCWAEQDHSPDALTFQQTADLIAALGISR